MSNPHNSYTPLTRMTNYDETRTLLLLTEASVYSRGLGAASVGPSMPMRSTTLGLISLALLRARAQPVFYDNYAVLTTNGATCTSAGLMPISSVSECETAVVAINAANGWSGSDSAYDTEDHSCPLPSGCSSRCKTASAGYYCIKFREARAQPQSVLRATATGTRTNEPRGAVAAELAPAGV